MSAWSCTFPGAGTSNGKQKKRFAERVCGMKSACFKPGWRRWWPNLAKLVAACFVSDCATSSIAVRNATRLIVSRAGVESGGAVCGRGVQWF